VAANGLEVLQAMERQSYDVTLMDILMPEMDGLMPQRPSAQRWHDRSKIIAVTASALKGDRKKGLAARRGQISQQADEDRGIDAVLADCNRLGRKELP